MYYAKEATKGLAISPAAETFEGFGNFQIPQQNETTKRLLRKTETAMHHTSVSGLVLSSCQAFLFTLFAFRRPNGSETPLHVYYKETLRSTLVPITLGADGIFFQLRPYSSSVFMFCF